MEVFSNLRGTLRSLLQIGRGGPQLKANTAALEARSAADDAYTIFRGAPPIAANDFVTRGYLEGLRLTRRLTANFTTTVVASSATALAFPCVAGEVWQFEYRGTMQCSAVGGAKYAIAAPAGSTIEGWLESTTTGLATLSKQRFTAVNTLGGVVHTVLGLPSPDAILAVVAAGANGTISVNVASAVAGQTTTLFANAYLLARKL